jgi:tetratricopeptide (TPR) repeat protein
MSLLLEALKKAEKAKEEAQRRSREGAAVEPGPDGAATPAAHARPVLTRPELPDIRQPLEILADDIAVKEHEPAPPRAAEASKEAQPEAAQRAAARKVFEAKFREPNPRLPFYIALGLLGAFAVGVVGYFWYQLSSPTLFSRNPSATGQVITAPTPAPKIASTPAPATPTVIPGLSAAPTAPGAPSAETSAPTTPAAKPAAQVRPPPRSEAPPSRLPASRSAAPRLSESVVSQGRMPPQVHPKVDMAYSAYLAGDLAAARTGYQEALRDEAANRDALLGLAAIDVRTGRYESAEATYLRLLQADPSDAHAQAAIFALRANRLDPIATESRVKNLLAADPGANVLHFTLGNQLAQQGRWPEAQQQYFKAFATDPDNADFAYNLAVSLDHLRQSKLALDYYRRAIALAEKRAASFDLAAARNRASQLGN